MLELNKIYNIDCLEGLRGIDANSVDLTVTSPPYDDLRTYDETCEWNFEIFKPIAKELYRVTKDGGVLVWVIGDAAKDGSETGSSFKQALYFKEIGFKLHDTMIYEKNSSTFPARLTSKRYSQIFEYMFVFVKGKKIRDDIKLIADKRNKWAGWTNWGEHSQYDVDGKLNKTSNIKPIAEFSLRTNIWRYPVSFNDKTGHPAVFPEKLAEDHILSWTNEGDVVLDPFMGSGTTAKMAMLNKRKYIGFEKNTDYYEKSLERLKKYEGKFNEDLSGITANDIINEKEWLDDDGNPVIAEPGSPLIVNVKEDKDLEKKAQLWQELTKELQDYFNEQSLGILKNLKVNLVFVSKANDKRVEKVKQEKQLAQTENFYQVEENVNVPESTITTTNNTSEVAPVQPLRQEVKPVEEKEFDLKKDVEFWMPAANPVPETVEPAVDNREDDIYAQNLVWCFMSTAINGVQATDVRTNKDYQSKNIDFIINGVEVCVKTLGYADAIDCEFKTDAPWIIYVICEKDEKGRNKLYNIIKVNSANLTCEMKEEPKRCNNILTFFKTQYPLLFEEYMTNEEQKKHLLCLDY